MKIRHSFAALVLVFLIQLSAPFTTADADAVNGALRPFQRNDGPLKFRGKFEFGTFSPTSPLDRDYWTQRLDELKAEGYNAVVWLFGNSETWGGGQCLIRWDAIPEARELSPEAVEHNIETATWLFDTAREKGLANLLYSTAIYMTPAFAKAHGYDQPMTPSATVTPSHNSGLEQGMYCGVRDEHTMHYMESMIYELSVTYPALDGFYMALGEAVPGNRALFYREAIAPALKRSGRRPLFVAHQWQVPLEDYLEHVAPAEVYDNTWLGFHTYNGEQLTDAKPYPGLVEWAEATGLPTLPMIYPSNMLNLPFNSPRFAYDIVREIKKQEGFQGFIYWEMSGVRMSGLFRTALAYYGGNSEAYSDAPWLAMLEEQFGNPEAAQHFLDAFESSSRIVPELCALVWHPADVQRRELRLPYRFMTGDNGPDSWMSSPVRGRKLIPISIYARFAARNPDRYRGQNGAGYDYQNAIWSSQGGTVYDIVPETHLAKIRALGDEALAAADAAMPHVERNAEEARRIHGFMKLYQLLAVYYDVKARAAISALIYAEAGRPQDKFEAEQLADEAVTRYEAIAALAESEVNPVNSTTIQFELRESGQPVDALLALERAERADLARLFGWPMP